MSGKSACADITSTDLAGITTLAISNKPSLTTLMAGDFAGLTSLQIANTTLSSLPAVIFNEPTSLSSLTTLELNQNTSLTCLPFIPSSVTTLSLDKARSTYSACGAAVTLGASSVNVAEGATATYTVVLDAYPTDTVTVTPASSATGKATVSGALTFMQSNWSTTQSVTLTGVTAGAATISHTIAGGGYGNVSVGSVSVTVPVTGVCARTEEVRDAIVAAVSGKTACADITTTDLAGITTLSVTNESTLTTLKAGDFTGLTNLTTLTLSNNALSSLPVGVFDDLTVLTTLNLKGNGSLACLPAIPASVTTLDLDKAKNAYDVCGAVLTAGRGQRDGDQGCDGKHGGAGRAAAGRRDGDAGEQRHGHGHGVGRADVHDEQLKHAADGHGHRRDGRDRDDLAHHERRGLRQRERGQRDGDGVRDARLHPHAAGA